MTDVTVARMPAAVFRKAVHAHPDVCDQLLALFAGQIRMLANRVNEFTTLDVRHRIYGHFMVYDYAHGRGAVWHTDCCERSALDRKPGTNAMDVRATLKTSLRYEAAKICPADFVLRTMRGRWATHIIKLIGDRGTLHFGALKRSIPGISKKVLTAQLRRLEQAGILHRAPKPAARPEMLYSLTRRGQELKTFLNGLQELGERWQREDANETGPDECRTNFVKAA